MPVRHNHLGYIDGLRALAALYVVAFHASFCVPGLRVTGCEKLLGYGHFAVGVFITLSGYCLMLPVAHQGGLLRGGAWGFLRRRARRILPTYYIALAVSLLLIVTLIGHKTGSLWDVSLPITERQIIAHILLVQDIYRTSGSLSYPCWSIATEWQIYLVFPLLLMAWRKWGAYTGGLLGIAGGMILHRLTLHTVLVGLEPWYLGLFSMGMLGAWFADAADSRVQALSKRIPWSIIVIAALAGVCAYSVHEGLGGFNAHIALADYLVGLGTTALLVALSQQRSLVARKLFGWPPLVFIGTYAYSIYLMHAPIIQIIWQYGLRPLRLAAQIQFGLLEIVGLPLTVAVVYPFFLLFEKPWLVKRQGKPQQQTALDAALSPAP